MSLRLKHLKVLVKWTDDEILPVLAQYVWTSKSTKLIFSCSHGKLCLVLFQESVYTFSFLKMQKDCNTYRIVLVESPKTYTFRRVIVFY